MLLSHHVGRYGLGDSDNSRYESTTSINRPPAVEQGDSREGSKGLGFAVVVPVWGGATRRETRRYRALLQLASVPISKVTQRN